LLTSTATTNPTFAKVQAQTGGFIGLPSNMRPLVCASLLLRVPGPMVSAIVHVLGAAAAVGGFHIPRPNRLVLYSNSRRLTRDREWTYQAMDRLVVPVEEGISAVAEAT
jgi:hypothetical protein